MRLVAGAARTAGWLSRRLGRGGGTTLPGVILLRLRPNAIAEMTAGLRHGCVLLSATNGKTTTTHLLVAAAEACGLRVVTNGAGSNLERGVATALLDGADAAEIGIFEVDEAALPAVARATRPRGLVLMNLFRDQLDRYGELDTLVDSWHRLVEELDGESTLVLNADDPNVADLAGDRGDVVWFGVDDASHALAERAHAADATTCRRCGSPIDHDVVLLGHLGHWHCRSGDNARPSPTVAATRAELRTDGQRTALRSPAGEVILASGLPGLHNTYNLTAALAAASLLPGFDLDTAAGAIAATGAAFGRGERVEIDGRHLNLLLAKNPTGVNQNIRTVLAGDEAVHALVVLNDRTADGQDVSWIWDVDWEPLDGRLASLTISGDRAYDLALRFRYGGFDLTEATVEPDLARALDEALAATPRRATLHALPTYTAMLDLRAELTRRGLVDAFWEAS